MKLLRKILFPIAFIYWLVTFIRNWLYDINFFKSKSYNLPIIAIGNLSAGGTGKTPHTEYLIRLLKDSHKVAVLSRGYKRSTKGFVLANEAVSAGELGDESYQIHTKFPDVSVAVCEDRQTGIENLISNINPDVILLDDAFQHRKVNAQYYILLTAYDDLFSDDYILPFGNLRESAIGKKRANLVIVTKCPATLSEQEQAKVKQKLKVKGSVFFTSIDYDTEVFGADNSMNVSEIIAKEKVIVAGIAKPKYFVDYLNSGNDKVMIYSDHHNFSEQEISELNSLAQDKIIVTTEKDFVRLNGKIKTKKLFYLPIKVKFLNSENEFQSILTKAINPQHKS
ncbi:tetraacyldisaccharide 4'-kinase [Flavobacterium terrigena]|uniref:Tetraacyldisaccharide 4'-kinase n=1 Tax=Flavobacterium terrigena TaxID=402734 RepID=A0A1H6S5J5_9FLAO|nr:tetraacyldisaccharide 4'-kinase [Flavobacterium terrigena]SEI60067.1 lipid-A-disaccharide kinase [Flavobacterium terrigena]